MVTFSSVAHCKTWVVVKSAFDFLRFDPQELATFVLEKDPSVRLPYDVVDCKVNGLPITYEKEVVWTRAMKYLLTNLKWILSWSTSRAASVLS